MTSEQSLLSTSPVRRPWSLKLGLMLGLVLTAMIGWHRFGKDLMAGAPFIFVIVPMALTRLPVHLLLLTHVWRKSALAWVAYMAWVLFDLKTPIIRVLSAAIETRGTDTGSATIFEWLLTLTGLAVLGLMVHAANWDYFRQVLAERKQASSAQVRRSALTGIGMGVAWVGGFMCAPAAMGYYKVNFQEVTTMAFPMAVVGVLIICWSVTRYILDIRKAAARKG